MDFGLYGRERVHESVQIVKNVGTQVAEIALRLPGLILLELWWRKRDMTFDEMAEGFLEKAQFTSYLDIETLLDFVHRRDFDESAAHILSYSVLLLSMTFLTVSIKSLLRLYAHAVSFVLFGFAHYMSTVYVSLEQSSPDKELKLDDFIKLERHGFHFLAQIMLCAVQSMLLCLESDASRLCLAVFTAPIIARMCNCPLDKLIVAHNVACSMSMLFISIYVLHCVPTFWERFCEAGRDVYNLLATRGLVVGAATIWRRQRFSLLLTWAWLTMFFIRLYHEMFEKGRSWHETWPVILAGIAETTNTPLTMLALALTVACVCHWVQSGAQAVLDVNQWQQQHMLAHSGYMEGMTLLLLCAQTGLLGMRVEQKAFLLGLILFIVVSALLQSLFDIVDVQLQALSTSRSARRDKHIRCLSLATLLVFAPLALASTVYAFLPLDLWCSIILSNCILTSVHACSALLQYSIARADLNSDSWSRADSLSFFTILLTKMLEIMVAICVVAYGSFVTVVGEWTIASVAVLLLQVIVNVIQKMDALIDLFQKRRAAEANLLRLQEASEEQIRDYGDVCAICLQEMQTEVRITPCTHLFHSPCLRKWLAVKQVCPLCYADLSDKKSSSQRSEDGSEAGRRARRANAATPATAAERDLAAEVTRLLDRLDGVHGVVNQDFERLQRRLDARDMWPLMRGGPLYDSDDFDEEEEEEEEEGQEGEFETESEDSSGGEHTEYTLDDDSTDGDGQPLRVPLSSTFSAHT